MAVPRTALVVATRAVGPDARLLELELEGGGAFGHRGGQYVILNTNVVVADKAIKRAYSFASADANQERVDIIVKHLRGGPGSAGMHALDVGATFTFSGPWGKLQPETLPADVGRVVVVATDTGITAALGLVTARAFGSRLAGTSLVWLSTSDDDIVSAAYVAERLPRDLCAFRVVRAPMVGHPERPEFGAQIARAMLAANGSPAVTEAYLVGDGKVLTAARDVFLASGVADANVRLECFFNTPPKPAPAT